MKRSSYKSYQRKTKKIEEDSTTTGEKCSSQASLISNGQRFSPEVIVQGRYAQRRPNKVTTPASIIAKEQSFCRKDLGTAPGISAHPPVASQASETRSGTTLWSIPYFLVLFGTLYFPILLVIKAPTHTSSTKSASGST
jgi:hypothetical protein